MQTDTMLLLAFFVLSLAGNVVLGVRLQSSLASNLTLKPLAPVTHNLVENAQTEAATNGKVSVLRVKTLSGHRESLPLNKPTVIYVFDTQCRWCAKNIESLKAFASQEASKTRIIGLVRTSDGIHPYLAQNHLPFPVYVETDLEDIKRLDVVGTPQTVVIDNHGTIVHNWVGIYHGRVRDAVEDYFHIKIPEA